MADDLKDFIKQLEKLDLDKPSLNEGLGAKPEFGSLKLSEMTHDAPTFTNKDDDVKIKIRAGQAIKTTYKLLFGSGEKDCTRFAFSHTEKKGEDDYVITFFINFPRKGHYKFNIFALPASDAGNSYPCVYTYTIEAERGCKKAEQFPKQFSPWPAKACKMISPFTVDTNDKPDSVKFKVFIPGATAAAVTCGGQWFHFTEDKDEKDVWEGKVDLKHHWKDRPPMRLNACWPKADEKKEAGGGTTYDTLLEYTL